MSLTSSLKRRHFSLTQQEHVRRLRAHGMSIQAIAELTGIGKSSIGRMVPPTQVASAKELNDNKNVLSTSLVDKFIGLSWLDFWTVLGPPLNKQGEPTECWSYELDLIDDINKHRRLAINKARGVGATELFLRYILYECLSLQKRGNYVIVCGNTFEIARSLMRRLKAILIPHSIYTDDRETVLSLPGCRIQAFSSEVNSFRSLTDVRFILADEVDSLDNGQDIRAVIDAYSVKTDAQIVLCSTPGQIDSTMHRLFKEAKSLYKRITLPYTVAVDKLYSKEEIEYLKLTSPSFKREFECVWGYIHEGSSFTDAQIRRATSIPYSLEPDYDVLCSLGCDPGFTSGHSGAFGITIVQKSDGLIKVKYCHTYQNAEHSSMVNEVVRLMEQWHVDKVWIDSSAVSTIQSIKEAIGENPQYGPVMEMARHNKQDPYLMMDICPVNFGTQHKQLLFHAKALMSDGLVAIDPTAFPNLVAAIQVAKDRDNAYIKSEGQFTDEFDSWRLSINSEMFELRGGNI